MEPVVATHEFALALARNQDTWVPANGGHERPFNTRTGLCVLHCYNPAHHRHALVSLRTGMELVGEEMVSLIRFGC